MTKIMTDHDALYGEFRAVTCEWIGEDDSRCRMPAIYGKSFCNSHYHLVFKTMSTKEYEILMEQEFNLVSKMKEHVKDESI